MPELTDQQCLDLLRANPRDPRHAEQAFATLFQRHDPALQRKLRAAYPSLTAEDVAELCQTAWQKAWEAVRRFAGDKFRAWLFQIGRNGARDLLRRRGHHQETPHGDGEWPAAHPDHANLLALADQLRHCMEQLGQAHRQIIVRLAEGFSYDEIAALLELPKARLYQMKLEARRSLQGCMEKGS